MTGYRLTLRAALGAFVLVAATLAIGGCGDLLLYDLLGGERGGNLAPGATVVNLEVNSNYSASASGGFAPYAFSVFGSGAPARGSIEPQSGLYTAPSVLPVGEDYTSDTVVIVDYIGTTVSMTVRSFERLRSTPPGASVDVDGNLVLTISGGVPPYAAEVADETGTPVITRGEVSILGDEITFTAPSTPGKSLVIVSDEIGNETVVTIHVIDPAAVAITPLTATIEFGEIVVFSISSGTLDYVTTLEPTGFGSIDDTDPEAPTYTAPIGGPAGVAQITVTDDDGVGSSVTATVYVVGATPDELVIAPAFVEIRPSHSATFTVGGGTPGYAFTLQPNSGSIEISGSTVVYTAAGTPGNVRLKVTDQSGQEASATIRIRN